MATSVGIWHDSRLFIDGYDMTAQASALKYELKAQDLTYMPYGSGGWEKVRTGKKSVTIDGSLYWDASAADKPDGVLWDSLATAKAISVIPALGVDYAGSAAVGQRAWVTEGITLGHNMDASPGKISESKLQIKGTGKSGRGVVLHDPGVARTATGFGTGNNFGAVAAPADLIINLHVLSISGTGTPTITVVVQSEADDAWGSPATVASFTARTTVGSQTIRVPAPITDTWLRTSHTISGTNPSFLYLVTVGKA